MRKPFSIRLACLGIDPGSLRETSSSNTRTVFTSLQNNDRLNDTVLQLYELQNKNKTSASTLVRESFLIALARRKQRRKTSNSARLPLCRHSRRYRKIKELYYLLQRLCSHSVRSMICVYLCTRLRLNKHQFLVSKEPFTGFSNLDLPSHVAPTQLTTSWNRHTVCYTTIESSDRC